MNKQSTQSTPQPYLSTKTHGLCSFTDPDHLITSTESVSPSERLQECVTLITITNSLITLSTAFTSLMSEGLLSKTCETIPAGQTRPRTTHTFTHTADENCTHSVIPSTNGFLIFLTCGLHSSTRCCCVCVKSRTDWLLH